ncbi:hypothetical protein GP486_005073 [Trichoglossum hirsutum]|uniref:NB-ARC domain-containing protein n=1 Tax=Trichoglossum hirsutum TaxID=265104 RepID=A0A9P8RMY2_9PEZI|nr:hypothetical protein GP486_005073 [Trichoglossum hirsutum]
MGSSSATWGTLLLNISSVFTKTNAAIIKHLKTNSEWLQQQLDQFTAISSDFKIKYCYEAFETPLILGKSAMIVPRVSAVVQGRPDIEALCLSKNHIELVRFTGANDEDFVSVASNLRAMIGECQDKIARNWTAQALFQSSVEAEANNIGACPETKSTGFYKLPFRMPIERNPMFIGRGAHLQQIHEYLCPTWNDCNTKECGSGQIVVLYGLGGMGKTQLALTYAAEQQEHFSAILWVDGSSRRNAQLGFRKIAQRYVDNASEKRGPEGRLEIQQQLHLGDLLTPSGQVTSVDIHLSEVTKLTISFLEREGNNNWLLVLDNVDDLQEVDIVDFFQGPRQGK